MEILTADQMRRVDRRAIDEHGLAGSTLMERAGRGVAEALLADLPGLAGRGVRILCGKGNNGGDGLVVARVLLEHAIRADVLLLARAQDLRGDAAGALRRSREAGVQITEIPDDAAWRDAAPPLADGALTIDAMLGTGVSGGARGLVATAIHGLDEARAEIVSIDLPSGVSTDSGRLEGPAVTARLTYTLCRPKPALVWEPAASRAGRWRVIPIGVPDEAVAEERASLHWLDADEAALLLPAREPGAHKGRFGHVLVVAGSRDASGAAVLAGRGALRCGAGLVTVSVPRGVQPVVAAQQAELMTAPLAEGPDGTLETAAVDAVVRLAATRDAVALGPGLGRDTSSAEAIRMIVGRLAQPLVLDADGLNAFEGRAETLRGAPGSPSWVVLTPHPGEAGRLLGCDAAAVQADRPAAARALVAASGATVVLKGRRTIVAAHDGRMAVCASGNPGMATAGSGDVLTGAIGAFLARGLDPYEAARLAVFAHADAGDRAAAALGEDGTIASDLVAALPCTLLALVQRRRGA